MECGVGFAALSCVHACSRRIVSCNAVITIAIRLRFDYDASRAPASIWREQKMNMSMFRRSRIVVESQLWYRLKARAQQQLLQSVLRVCYDANATAVSETYKIKRNLHDSKNLVLIITD